MTAVARGLGRARYRGPLLEIEEYEPASLGEHIFGGEDRLRGADAGARRGGALWSQHSQSAVLERIVDRDVTVGARRGVRSQLTL